jgi:hypothetical protein
MFEMRHSRHGIPRWKGRATVPHLPMYHFGGNFERKSKCKSDSVLDEKRQTENHSFNLPRSRALVLAMVLANARHEHDARVFGPTPNEKVE